MTTGYPPSHSIDVSRRSFKQCNNISILRLLQARLPGLAGTDGMEEVAAIMDVDTEPLNGAVLTTALDPFYVVPGIVFGSTRVEEMISILDHAFLYV